MVNSIIKYKVWQFLGKKIKKGNYFLGKNGNYLDFIVGLIDQLIFIS